MGYNKTHFGNGEFSSKGSYITQLDFDGGGKDWKDKGNYPIVGQVKYCPLCGHGRSSGSGPGGKGSYAGGVGQGDLEALWNEIDGIVMYGHS